MESSRKFEAEKYNAIEKKKSLEGFNSKVEQAKQSQQTQRKDI